MTTTGIDFSEMMGGEDMSAAGVLIDPVIKFMLYPESVLGISLGVFGLTMIAGLYPAFRAGREAPVDTLKSL